MSRRRSACGSVPSERDGAEFRRGLAQAAHAFQLELHAYCLMGNHYHLLLRARAPDLPRVLGGLVAAPDPASRTILLRAHRHVVHVSRYIHLNPVEAGLARRAEEWPHSSYRAYLDPGFAPGWLETRSVLGFFGSIGARHAYRRFVEAGLDPGSSDSFGRPRFRSLLEDERLPPGPRLPLPAIARAVSSAFDGRLARGAFVHAARHLGGWRLREIAAWLGQRSYQAPARAALRFESAAFQDPSLLARLAQLVERLERRGPVYTRGPGRDGMTRTERHDLKAIARKAMLERGLLPGFSPQITSELERLGESSPKLDAEIRDLRDLTWISIDNDDSRDLDQLSYADPAGPVTTRVRVAIADVDALVPRGSAVDARAEHNTTSIYTAAENFPMLPVQLSYDLTSLVEDQDRLALVVEMVVGEDGELSGSGVYRARVRNHAKLAYNSVAAWLEGGAPAPPGVAGAPEVEKQLRLQDRVAQVLRGVRHRQGALSLETIEPRAVMVEGALTDLVVEEKNRAKELIEDLMIAVNGITARFLESRGMASFRRVLRSPERWERIVELAAGYSVTLPGAPDAQALEGFLATRRQADPKRFPDLSLKVVKLMGRGEYVVERPGRAAPGHFGLAVHDYTHSTAPNRRFPDLLTQRLLKAALAGAGAPYRDDELDSLALHCTRQEDNANKVERLVRKAAAALLLEPRIGERFDGIVTGASEKGTWVRIFHPPAEGRVVQGSAGLDVGEEVTVELVDTDVERGYIDFARVHGGAR